MPTLSCSWMESLSHMYSSFMDRWMRVKNVSFIIALGDLGVVFSARKLVFLLMSNVCSWARRSHIYTWLHFDLQIWFSSIYIYISPHSTQRSSVPSIICIQPRETGIIWKFEIQRIWTSLLATLGFEIRLRSLKCLQMPGIPQYEVESSAELRSLPIQHY